MKKLLLLSLILFTIFIPKVDAALTDGLVAYWTLDESSNGSGAVTRSDSTANNNDLTDGNTTASAAAVISNGANFEDDNNEYLSIVDASQTGLNITGDYSASFWYKPETLPSAGNVYYFYTRAVGALNKGYGLGYYGDTGFVIIIGNGTTYTFNKAYTLSVGTQYYITLTFDASASSVELFVNGSSIGTASNGATSISSNTGTFVMGSYTGAGWADTDGIIDEFGVWNRVLTAGEIASLYNGGSGFTYPFSTATPCDYSGTGNWQIKYSSNCYITTNIYINGVCQFMYDAAGSFGIANGASISCGDIQAQSGFRIQGAAGAKIFAR